MSRIPGIAKRTAPSTADTSRKSTAADSAATLAGGAEEDPIEYSIQIREAQGGLTSQLTDAQATQKKVKTFKAQKLATLKGKDYLEFIEGGDSKVTAAAGSKLPRPSTAVTKTPSTLGSKKIGAGSKLSGIGSSSKSLASNTGDG
jgi:hypothetical protein